jgi:hypothetical protein
LTGCFVLGTTSAAICKGRAGTIKAGDVLDVVCIHRGIHHSVGVVFLVGRVRGRSEGMGIERRRTRGSIVNEML